MHLTSSIWLSHKFGNEMFDDMSLQTTRHTDCKISPISILFYSVPEAWTVVGARKMTSQQSLSALSCFQLLFMLFIMVFLGQSST